MIARGRTLLHTHFVWPSMISLEPCWLFADQPSLMFIRLLLGSWFIAGAVRIDMDRTHVDLRNFLQRFVLTRQFACFDCCFNLSWTNRVQVSTLWSWVNIWSDEPIRLLSSAWTASRLKDVFPNRINRFAWCSYLSSWKKNVDFSFWAI